MVQRLMHPPHVLARQTSSHGFNTFTFPRQQQPSAVILQWHHAISVPCGFRQAKPSIYAAKRRSCGLGVLSLPTKQFYTKLSVYNTVVLEAVPELLQLATDRVMNNGKRVRP